MFFYRIMFVDSLNVSMNFIVYKINFETTQRFFLLVLMKKQFEI